MRVSSLATRSLSRLYRTSSKVRLAGEGEVGEKKVVVEELLETGLVVVGPLVELVAIATSMTVNMQRTSQVSILSPSASEALVSPLLT